MPYCYSCSTGNGIPGIEQGVLRIEAPQGKIDYHVLVVPRLGVAVRGTRLGPKKVCPSLVGSCFSAMGKLLCISYCRFKHGKPFFF